MHFLSEFLVGGEREDEIELQRLQPFQNNISVSNNRVDLSEYPP